jgi:probable addiction module antidote protein
MVKVSKFDAADYLKTPAAIAAYLTEAFETNDPIYILTAFDTVARAKEITDISKATGLARESPYKTFKENARPEFETVRKVMGSFGVKLVAEPIEEQEWLETARGEAPQARKPLVSFWPMVFYCRLAAPP